MVHIIGENSRYIEPFLAEIERGCQGGGSHNRSLYKAGGRRHVSHVAASGTTLLGLGAIQNDFSNSTE